MDLEDYKIKTIRQKLGLSSYNPNGTTAFIDFANVNKWFENSKSGNMHIDLIKLKEFLQTFCDDIRFYYGTDTANAGSLKFIGAASRIFGSKRVFTKPVQKIKHRIISSGNLNQVNLTKSDYVIISKSNFDVEITLDAIRLASKYEKFCLLSGDSDFAPLLRYLRSLGKKNILMKNGFIQDNLRKSADLVISGCDIFEYITSTMQKPT